MTDVCLDVVHFFSSPYSSYNFSSIFAKTWHTCSVYYTHKTGFFSNFAFRIFGQFLIFFFKLLIHPTVFSLILTKFGTHDVCTNAQKNYGTDFQNFDCEICCTAADRAVSTDRRLSSVSYSSIQK